MTEFPVRLELRITQEMADAVEDWRASQRPVPTRQEAIRELLAMALRLVIKEDRTAEPGSQSRA